MVAYVTASIVLTNLRVKLRRDMNDKDKYTRGILADALGAWETIKYFSGEEREMKRYTDALKAYQKSEFKVIASLNFLNLLQNGIISLGLLVGALIVAFSVVQGTRYVKRSNEVGRNAVFKQRFSFVLSGTSASSSCVSDYTACSVE